MDINKINTTRQRRNQKELRLSPLCLNINGRKFREDEINIKLSELYPETNADLDWTFPEIWDPWKRANKHMELFDDAFGNGRTDLIRFDHFLESTHICDGYKWLNRAYQLLKKGGILNITVVDFKYLCNKILKTDEMKNETKRIVELEQLEKKLFTESDSSGMYYHRTLWTEDRIAFYLEKSFFYEYEFTKSFHEVLGTDIIELRAMKDTDYKTILAPDGTLQKTD